MNGRGGEVRLRDVEPEDLPIFFGHQSDPEAVALAQVAPRDRAAFMAHWAGILGDPWKTVKTVLCDDVVAGYVASWGEGEERRVGYWLGRETWGRGVATRALAAFLALVPRRPLTAYVAVDNVASRRVLEKCGFVARPGGPRRGEDGVVEHVMVLGDAPERPLWPCPACGRAFANRNQPHACGTLDLDHHFEGKPARIRALFDAFAAEVQRIGPVVILPEKTRIAFQVRMSFAQVTPKRSWLDGHVVLARVAGHPAIRRVETMSARSHVHVFRIVDEADIEALLPLLIEAYATGEQRHVSGR